MGRYSQPLAGRLRRLARGRGRPARDRRRLRARCADPACWSTRLGADHVRAVDPSEQFVAACRERLPGVDVRQGAAESLPFGDATCDVAAACLVVHFMSDPVGGLREMRRVTRPAAGSGPRSGTWRARGRRWHRCGRPSQRSRPSTPTRRELPGRLARQPRRASSRPPGCATSRRSSCRSPSPTRRFEEWWEPYLHGVGPAGEAVAALEPERPAAAEESCGAASATGRSTSPRWRTPPAVAPDRPSTF